jgi:hypothetical protein
VNGRVASRSDEYTSGCAGFFLAISRVITAGSSPRQLAGAVNSTDEYIKEKGT